MKGCALDDGLLISPLGVAYWAMRTLTLIAILFIPPLVGLLLTQSTPAYSVEPLSGPEIGQSWWTGSSDSASTDKTTSHERHANIDIPIPTAIGVTMPFATFRYIDRDSSKSPRYDADQQVGIGLMHHSAEGDPAWRFDAARGGVWAAAPSLWTRAIVNLAKPFSWIKPRPSDTVFSWLGVNILQKRGNKNLIIPEFAWIREGADGLAVDLIAPRHFLIGFRNSRFGLMAGAEQSLISYSTSAGEEQTADWTIRRLTRIKFLAALSDEFFASISALKPYGQGSDHKAVGAEVSLRWNPNP